MNDSVSYLIRFDDICPTMNWEIWKQIEKVLLEENIKPIIAVVPDNRDEKLMVDSPRKDFWEQVRKWQTLGWTIGLHGYQHKYINKNSGLIGLNRASEFAGLAKNIQEEKLKKGLEIFQREKVAADIWVAPSHSFDRVTVSLLQSLGMKMISDGFAYFPYFEDNIIWVPQQIWKFLPKKKGYWTVCYHHNNMNNSDVAKFINDIKIFKNKIVRINDVLNTKKIQKKRFLRDIMLGELTKMRIKGSRMKSILQG